MTPKDHPDRADLKRANADILMVAEHINESKKRYDLVGRIVSKKDSQTPSPVSRTAPNKSDSSFIGSKMTKKFLRSSQKAKQAVGLAEQKKDEMFDELVGVVDSTRSSVLRFSTEMKEAVRTTKVALDAQAVMVEHWRDVYSPELGGVEAATRGQDRLTAFLESVLTPVIAGPWKQLVSASNCQSSTPKLTSYIIRIRKSASRSS